MSTRKHITDFTISYYGSLISQVMATAVEVILTAWGRVPSENHFQNATLSCDLACETTIAVVYYGETII